MNQRPADQNDQTEAIPQQADDTTRIDAADTARMPPASDAPDSPPGVGQPQWAPAVDGAAAVFPGGPSGPVPAAATPAKSAWWKGPMALAAAALVAGLGIGAAAGATTAVAIGGTDDVTQVTEGGRGGFDGGGRPPGGRHGGGMGELPDGEGLLPGGGQGGQGGQGEVPGGGTSSDPGDSNTTDQTT